MEIILAALTGMLVLAAVAWTGAMLSAAAADRRAGESRAAEQEREHRAQERERRMRGDPILLHCAACDRAFMGPLAESGCPGCRSSALVVPDDEYREIKRQGAFHVETSELGESEDAPAGESRRNGSRDNR